MTRKRPGLSAGTFLFTATKKNRQNKPESLSIYEKTKGPTAKRSARFYILGARIPLSVNGIAFSETLFTFVVQRSTNKISRGQKMRPSPGDIRVIKPLRRPSNLCEVASLLLNSSKFGPSQSFLFSNKDHATTTRFPDIPANGIVYPATTIPCSSAARAAMRPASTISRAR